MISAVVGVASTGKTTICNSVKGKLGDSFETLPEVTRGEVFNYCNMPVIDLQRASTKQRMQYDVGRLEMQMLNENRMLKGSSKSYLIDSAVPTNLAYALYLSGQFMDDKELSSLVEEALTHSCRMYDAIFYLPFGRIDYVKAMHRQFDNHYLLQAMDRVLQYVLFDLMKSPKIVTVNSVGFREVYQEITKQTGLRSIPNVRYASAGSIH